MDENKVKKVNSRFFGRQRRIDFIDQRIADHALINRQDHVAFRNVIAAYDMMFVIVAETDLHFIAVMTALFAWNDLFHMAKT